MHGTWSLARIILLAVGLAQFLVFVQVTLYHYRQNFRVWPMWIPVFGTSVIGLTALIAALSNWKPLATLAALTFGIGTAAGIIGFYYHYVGVGHRVGGYQLQNFLVGPPIILPLLISALSFLGLLAIYWR